MGVNPFAVETHSPRFRVSHQLARWHDPARGRAIPVKVYCPEADGAFPVIVYSHGLGGTRQSGAAWGRHWAGHGYLCVHLQHSGSDDAALRALDGAHPDPASLMHRENWMVRAQDVSFALDELARRTEPGREWHGRADLDRIGLAGHSFGAGTVLAVCGQRIEGVRPDPRVRAGIALCPAVVRGGDLAARYGGIALPLLHITGTRDDSPISDLKAHQRRIPFDHMPGPDKHLLVLEGADHMAFNGHVRRGETAEVDRVAHRAIRAVTMAFWDAYLQGDAAARRWLAAAATASEIRGHGSFESK
jgi:predicted dienelactone hydrolase